MLSPESITGDPRENQRAQAKGQKDASFNGTLNESFTPEKQKSMVDNATSKVGSLWGIAAQSDRGSLDFKPDFKAGQLIDLNGIYMNNHEAINYMWGEAMSDLNSSGKTTLGIGGQIPVGTALYGAEMFNIFDYFTGDTKTLMNQPNHDEAIIRGFLNNSEGSSNDTKRDKEVQKDKPKL